MCPATTLPTPSLPTASTRDCTCGPKGSNSPSNRSRADEVRTGAGGGGFAAALQNLADHTDAATATATAKMIGYPTTGLSLGTQHRSWRTVLLGLASLALAVLIGRCPAYLTRRRRRRPRSLDHAPTPDSGGAPSSAVHANARTHV